MEAIKQENGQKNQLVTTIIINEIHLMLDKSHDWYKIATLKYHKQFS